VLSDRGQAGQIQRSKAYREPEYSPPPQGAAPYQRRAEAATCFPGNASVLTPSGYRRIDSMAVGEAVISWETKGSRITVRHVSKVIVHPSARIWSVGFGHARASIRVTGFHKLLTKGGWIRVDKLKVGDWLIVYDERTRSVAKVVQVEKTVAQESVYNLMTTGEHNFIVEGTIAHNFTVLRYVRTLVHQLLLDPLATRRPRTSEITNGRLSPQLVIMRWLTTARNVIARATVF
jgi:hypothetical protein